MSESCQSAVALIIFNRPEVTARVFAAIRAARPPTLFVIADGPRPTVAEDADRCAATRAVVEQIDWPCQVFRKFAPSNLGLRRNVSEGLDWVFTQTEEAIVLEDDCLPDPTFFRFCDELLERYRDDANIGMICGSNLAPDATAMEGASYYFSRHCYIWGWATWRRAWRCYDRRMAEWPSLRKNGWLQDQVETSTAINYWRRHFDDCCWRHPDGLDTWDVALVFAFWRHHLRAIVPRHQLVSNLGFGPEATHTKYGFGDGIQSSRAIEFPIRHPTATVADRSLDRRVQERLFEVLPRRERVYWRLRLPLPIWVVRRLLRWSGR